MMDHICDQHTVLDQRLPLPVISLCQFGSFHGHRRLDTDHR